MKSKISYLRSCDHFYRGKLVIIKVGKKRNPKPTPTLNRSKNIVEKISFGNIDSKFI